MAEKSAPTTDLQTSRYTPCHANTKAATVRALTCRCMKCRKQVEMTSTDRLADVGMICVGTNLYYCVKCGKEVGLQLT